MNFDYLSVLVDDQAMHAIIIATLLIPAHSPPDAQERGEAVSLRCHDRSPVLCHHAASSQHDEIILGGEQAGGGSHRQPRRAVVMGQLVTVVTLLPRLRPQKIATFQFVKIEENK